MVLTEGQAKMLDDMEMKYYRHVYKTIMKETFGDIDEEKNSSAT